VAFLSKLYVEDDLRLAEIADASASKAVEPKPELKIQSGLRMEAIQDRSER
jgi:hypothetical protein